MKKFIAVLMAVCLMATMSVIAFAADIDQDTIVKSQDVKIGANIPATYVVSIPADFNITFNAESSDFGKIELKEAQIEVNKAVEVSLTKGDLKNEADETKKIPYKITDGTNEFTKVQYLTDGDKTDLKIDIKADDWAAAYAGVYKATLTFAIDYVSTGVQVG